MAFTMVDSIILVIVLASALMALLRGLTRELLTIFAWVTAAGGGIYFFPYAREPIRAYMNPPILADAVAFSLVFLIVLVPSLMLTSHICRRFGRDDPGVFDRTGGFLFGIARGLFIIGLAYWINAKILQPDAEPAWIADARLKPIVVSVASIFPSEVDSIASNSQKPKKRTRTSSERESDEGYAQRDRRSLDQLITTTSED